MEDLIGGILEIIFKPFEPLFDDAFEGIKKIRRKWVRVVLRIVLIAIPLSIFLIVYLVCRRIFGEE